MRVFSKTLNFHLRQKLLILINNNDIYVSRDIFKFSFLKALNKIKSSQNFSKNSQKDDIDHNNSTWFSFCIRYK